MRDIPCNLSGYTLMLTEPPEMKTREGKDGQTEVVTDRDTKAALFVVSLFAKQRRVEGRKAPRGEEIKVTVEADPGELEDGAYVELIDPRVSPYSFKNDEGQTVSGISFRAAAIKPRG